MKKKRLVSIAIVATVVMTLGVLALKQQRSAEWVKQTYHPTSAGEAADQSSTHPLIRTPPISQDTAPVAPPPPESDAEIPPGVVTPPARVDQSDSSVMQAVADLNATLTQWLLPEEQVRKWVVLVNLLADGKIPTKHRPLEYPLTPFKVTKKDGRLWGDPANQNRIDSLINSVEQISPQQCAHYFHAWEPLLQKAYDELGIGGQFRDRLLQAFEQILAVKPLQGEFELKLKKSARYYVYVEPALENASGLEKLMWRMGAANTLRVQHYLQRLKPLI